MKRMLALLPFAVMLCTDASAQTGLTGTWHETTQSGLNAELNLDATAAALTGTFTVRSRTLTISDGKVTKNTFTFKAPLEGQPEGFSGELAGDSIVLWRDRNGKGDAITLQRAAPSLTGKWEGQTPNGMNLTLDLVEKAQALSGTVTRDGAASPISDGKVSKNTFTFKATLDGATETIEGTVENGEMKAWLTRQGPERTAHLKKVKR